MGKNSSGTDQLFLQAEQLAIDFSLFRHTGRLSQQQQLGGLLSEKTITTTLKQLKKLSVDDYITRTILPTETKSRPGAKSVLRHFNGNVLKEVHMGPLYAMELELDLGSTHRRVGFLAQERTSNNGVWMPEHHLKAIDIIHEFAEYSIPLVTIIDTPGADAGEIANRENQAHSISRLITEMGLLDIPTVGLILGNGYSGGAIPLATTNILLSVRDGVFNTIQPRGLASIARKYKISWQECAKYVGVSPYELYKQGYIDGIIDYIPDEGGLNFENLRQGILSSIESIEKGVKKFVNQNSYVFSHYRRCIRRFINPSEHFERLQKQSSLSRSKDSTSHLNIFGTSYRYLRYLTLRNRISSTTIEQYGRLSRLEIPKGDLEDRIEKEHRDAFLQWLNSPLAIKYDNVLKKSWNNYQYFKKHLHEQRGKFRKFILGDPVENYRHSVQDLNLCFGFHLYNLWKIGAPSNFRSLIDYLQREAMDSPIKAQNELTVLDVILSSDLRTRIVIECKNFIIFDLIYDNIVSKLIAIAKEAKESNTISKESVKHLIDDSLNQVIARSAPKLSKVPLQNNDVEDDLRNQFIEWLHNFIKHPKRNEYLKSVEEWKKIAFPRFSEPLFAVITFIFEHLLPSYYESESGRKTYNGTINLRNIGIKDFWNRLTIAYHDLLIHDVLTRNKRSKKIGGRVIIEKFFSDFREFKSNLMTCDPANFPGFRISIEASIAKGITPCGILTGTARFKANGQSRRVGVVVSNLEFQAGAFDMASAEKFCKLLVVCAQRNYPVICFISSGGMQTKEGAGALFSMAIVNDRITRFVLDNDLPVLCFGFGDCTGGAQASFVTHPLVQTYYFSGTNMPFAGQIVVPSYLPTTSTLSNYLSKVSGAMQGVVKHPFFHDLDTQLKEIDPQIPEARETVEEVIIRILKGELTLEEPEDELETKTVGSIDLMKKVNRVLIHARGCTAVKLITIAQRLGINIVLVQSDADMDSVAAEMLTENDTLVCLGGNTSDESYLNAQSVIRIAERENVDSLHPGIGFLSENPYFASLCQYHQVNFIGPPVHCMELMGNKSNAINTALKLKIPVVPGSHGVITNPEAAAQIADKIEYPVVIKAVHGGGGKGIKILESPDNFYEIFLQMMAEAKSAFGSSDLYIEKCVTSLRHVEVQILRDRFGNTKILGLRDCTVQRNNQKIIEESGSTLLPEDLREALFSYSKAIADDIGYIGAGTVEFMYDLKDTKVYFMEMNTRLQVEHPVTELVTGIDIVATQFDIASGKSIESLDVTSSDYAMEVRITAEKVALDASGNIIFIPDPGEITDYHFPKKKGMHIISTVAKNKIIPSFYDNMIIQLICHGTNRENTIKKLLEYLNSVRIQGVYTNIPLLKLILSDEQFREGNYDTTFITKFLGRIDSKKLIKDTEEFAGDLNRVIDIDSLKIEGSDEMKVIAPSSGVFYITPSPSEPVFVTVGDTITAEKTLCLIEAMKVFQPISLTSFNNENSTIYSEDFSYQIIRINPANAQTVNTGDLLFVIKPVPKISEN